LDSQQQIALVTGSGRGLGRAMAIEFARRGLAVVVNSAHNSGEAEATAEEIRSLGGRAELIIADVSDPAAVRDLFDRVAGTFGRLDVLVNNAGINRDAGFREMDDGQWFDVLATNLSGPFLCSRAAVPLMERAGGGSIVHITARTAHRPRKRGANYCAAKAGLSMLAKCMALELAPAIRVNCVAPGTTDTSEVRERFDLDTQEGMARMLAPIALGRIATPEEIAKLVAFVALDATFMTGHDVVYDGGRNLT
jgi:3-oxoacyl-[acyl-carrier protein] reductase